MAAHRAAAPKPELTPEAGAHTAVVFRQLACNFCAFPAPAVAPLNCGDYTKYSSLAAKLCKASWRKLGELIAVPALDRLLLIPVTDTTLSSGNVLSPAAADTLDRSFLSEWWWARPLHLNSSQKLSAKPPILRRLCLFPGCYAADDQNSMLTGRQQKATGKSPVALTHGFAQFALLTAGLSKNSCRGSVPLTYSGIWRMSLPASS